MMLLLGAHMSIAGGVQNAIDRGEELGCTAIQIFLKWNTRWKGIPITPEQERLFQEKWKKSHIKAVTAHSAYLINLASPDDTTYERSMNAMKDEIRRASQLGIKYLTIHPGSHKGLGKKAGIKKIAESLDVILESESGSNVIIVLESTAGQGTGIGSRFEELAQIISASRNKRRLGVCLDTAHMFAAGYDIRTREKYEDVIREFDQIIGLSRLKLIHLNDSKKLLGSRVDRHTHIGEGEIGLDAFRSIMNDERLQNVPKILETPKEPVPEADRKNLSVLRGLTR